MRAKRGAAARAAGSDSSLSPARSGEGDGPDGRGPPGGETGRGGALGRLGQERGTGQRIENGPRERFLGRGEGVKEKPFSFSETNQTLSI